MSSVSENKRSILRGSFGSAAATMLARILGLLRVMLEARVLGGNALASIWAWAFAIPNLFRRLLGEGALSQALIPMLSHTEAEKGIAEVRRQLALVLSALTVLLIIICIITSAISLLAGKFIATDYIREALKIVPLLMPYSIFICLVGVMTAVVNTRGVFFLASLNALILNVVMIFLLYLADRLGGASSQKTLYVLICGVLTSGVLQAGLLAFLLKKYGIFPVFRKSERPAKSIFSELWHLTLPGLIGGGAVQISFLIDRAIALSIGDYAVPALNYTERLVYLPVGIVAVALSSVLMANMSRAAANKCYDEMLDDMALGLRFVWFGCAPLAIFMIAYREPVIRVLFQYGRFTAENAAATADALFFYAMGIPAFCAVKVILPMFYARKKMHTPLKISLVCMALNVPLSIILMFPLKQGGIALATVISQLLNNTLLLYFLKRENFSPEWKGIVLTMTRSIIFALPAVFPAYWFGNIKNYVGDKFEIIILIACGLFAAVCYLAMQLAAKAPEPREFISSLVSRKSRKKEK